MRLRRTLALHSIGRVSCHLRLPVPLYWYLPACVHTSVLEYEPHSAGMIRAVDAGEL